MRKAFVVKNIVMLMVMGSFLSGSIALAHHETAGRPEVRPDIQTGGQIYIVNGSQYRAVELLKYWNKFVGNIENANSISLKEYHDALIIREAIQEIGLNDSLLKKDDIQFKNSLIRRDILVKTMNNPALRWLGQGVPRRVSRDFIRDLREQGVRI